MSWWTKLRDTVEHLVVNTAKAAAPTMDELAANAGKAILTAVQEKGISHGTDDAIHAAKASILSDAPHLEVTVATALAASVAAEFKQEHQKATDPGQPPQASG